MLGRPLIAKKAAGSRVNAQKKGHKMEEAVLNIRRTETPQLAENWHNATEQCDHGGPKYTCLLSASDVKLKKEISGGGTVAANPLGKTRQERASRQVLGARSAEHRYEKAQKGNRMINVSTRDKHSERRRRGALDAHYACGMRRITPACGAAHQVDGGVFLSEEMRDRGHTMSMMRPPREVRWRGLLRRGTAHAGLPTNAW
ncbi:hypothetical protein FB451DRAFT_1191148 [Mycena latifolia]|nr:hypothetical protein FB451DRAFT_1191148 [Mycena latifolia]